MEASQQQGQAQQEGQEQEAQPATTVPQASPAAQQPPVTEQQEAQAEAQPAAGHSVPPAEAEERLAEQDVDRNPAEEQAPVATAAQGAIIGDPGFRDEQQPDASAGGTVSADMPVRTSAPPAELQSGVPLPEDRAAAAQEAEGGEERREQRE